MNTPSGNSHVLSRGRETFTFSRLVTLFCAVLLAAGLAATAQSGHTAPAAAFELATLNGPNGFRLEGRAAGDAAGSALIHVGDMNGDGLDDFAIGAPTADPAGKQGAGEVYVLFGRLTNPVALPLTSLNGDDGLRLTGATFNDEAGSALGGGDVNGDGYADLIIGAPGADPNDAVEAGSVYVVYGAADLPATLPLQSLNSANGFRLDGLAENDRAGGSVSFAGDMNGDGYGDVMIGAPDASPGGKENIGQAYVLFGQPAFPPVFALSGLNGDNGFVIDGVAADSFAGNVVGAAGDVNGDGYDDTLVAAWKYTTRTLESGTVFVLYGRADFAAKLSLKELSAANGLRIEGIATGDGAGQSAAAGDVNGDGRDDIVIGAPFAADHSGEAYVVFGQQSPPAVVELDTLNGGNGFRLSSAEANGGVGTAVATADVNGDGRDDVIVGAATAGSGSTRFAGRAYVIFGRSTFGASVVMDNLATDAGRQLNGVSGGDQAGQTVSVAGDSDGDGYDEFLIGAPNAGPALKSEVGAVYLVQGGPTLGVPMPLTHPGTANNDNLTGSGGPDVMHGDRGADRLDGAAEADALKGGVGNDTLVGGPGGDRLIGGNGLDEVAYGGSAVGVVVNLFSGAAGGGDATGDIFRSVERVTGSPQADTLTGDAGDNRLQGGGGPDTQRGGWGDDTFLFAPQSGDDVIEDFMPGAESEDFLDFGLYPAINSVTNLTVQAQGTDTRLTLPGGETITLRNVAANALHADDYRFAGAPLARPDSYGTVVNTPLALAAPGVLGNDDNPSQSAFTAVLVDAPAHGTLSLAANGSFTYIPAQNYLGTDEFTYRAHNGQNSNVARVTIAVNPTPPTAVDDAYLVELGTTMTIAAPGVLDNDSSPGSVPLMAAVVEEPVDGLLALAADGSFTYTPQVDYATQDSFTYVADNGLTSNVATVTITILDPDGPPVAADDRYNVPDGESLTVAAPGVLANDVNPLPGNMTVVLGDEPEHGTLTLNANGGFTYMPAAGFNGQDSFSYRASNGQLSNEAIVTLNVGDTGYLINLPVILRQ